MIIFWALLIFIPFEGSEGMDMEITPADPFYEHRCVGDNITTPWTVKSSHDDEHIETLHWIRILQGEERDTLAILTFQKIFLVPPRYEGRVDLNESKLSIHNLQTNDSGEYGFKSSWREDDGNDLIAAGGVMTLYVADELSTTDGNLHVSPSYEAAFDQVTNKSALHLMCGHFKFKEAPFPVDWTFPSGKMVKSKDYQNGQFLLLVTPPVAEGEYKCSVSASQACGKKAVSSQIKLDNKTVTIILAPGPSNETKKIEEKIKENEKKHNKTDKELDKKQKEINETIEKELKEQEKADKELDKILNKTIEDFKNDTKDMNETLKIVDDKIKDLNANGTAGSCQSGMKKTEIFKMDEKDLLVISQPFQNSLKYFIPDTSRKVRYAAIEVNFERPFKATPALATSLTLLEATKGKNLRALTTSADLTANGFKAIMATWDDSMSSNLAVAWMACEKGLSNATLPQ